MPQIVKQKPQGNSVPRSPAGSILSRAVAVEQVQENFGRYLFYGQNRVGKTTLLGQFPKPMLVVSFEPERTGGLISIKKIPGVKVLICGQHFQGSNEAVVLANELAQGAHCDLPGPYLGKMYATVGVESATSLQDVILAEILHLPEVPTQLNWGLVPEDAYRERSEKCKEVLRKFTKVPANVVFTAKERDHNRQQGERRNRVLAQVKEAVEAFFAADLGGATAGWLQDSCNYLGRLYVAKETERKPYQMPGGEQQFEDVETGRSIRRLRTMFHTNYAAGFRSCSPDAIPEWINSPTYDKIRQVIDGKRLSEKDAYYP